MSPQIDKRRVRIRRGPRFRWVSAFSLVPVCMFDAAWAETSLAFLDSDPEPSTRESEGDSTHRVADPNSPLTVGFKSIPASAIGVPEGFEDLDGPLETLFDVFFQDRRIGSVPGRLDGGYFTFLDPGGLADRLPGVIEEDVRLLLSSPLGANESIRCLPGQTEDCGVLPSGATGIIVDPERFRVDLFLGREYRNAVIPKDLDDIGMPVSGPSVIQNIAASLSANGSNSDIAPTTENALRIGFTSETLASIGRTSMVAQVQGTDDRGIQVDQVYAQRFLDNTRIAGGLIQTDGSASLNGFKMYGAEVSSFNSRARNVSTEVAMPIDIVLPRLSRVEIYRDGTLYSALQYPAGLQQLDTSRLPVGSYPIRIVARDASGVVLDEVRSFTKAADLPPVGETVYSVRVGVLAEENLPRLQGGSDEGSLFPATASQTVVAASVSRRITASSSATAALTAVDGELFPEAELNFYRGQLRATTAVAAGPDSQYAVSAAVNFQLGPVIGALSARKTQARSFANNALFDPTAYRPFLQSEESVFGNLQTGLFGGSIGLRGSLSRSELGEDRYAAGVSYNRAISRTFLGNGYFSFDALASDSESRIGLRLTFQRNAGRNASLTSIAGGDQFMARDEAGRDGFFPAALVGYVRTGQFGQSDFAGSASAGTAGGDGNLLLNGSLGSRRGEADFSTGLSQLRGSNQVDSFVTGNIRTGFVYSDGDFQFGSRGFGDAAVRVKLVADEGMEKDNSFFQVLVDNQPSQIVKPGQTASIIVPAFTRSSIGLAPVGAPSFDVDLTPRDVPLYPGNVVSLIWETIYVVAAFGRLVDEAGAGIGGAVLRTATDQAVSSEQGFFSVTGALGTPIAIRLKDGRECGAVTISSADSEKDRQDSGVLRLGQIACGVPTGEGSDFAAP